MSFELWKSCPQLVDDELDAHRQMIADARDVTYRTFRRAVQGLDEWAAGVGYDPPHTKVGLPLARDWHVAYFRSHWNGQRCYFLVWSAFEFIWLEGGSP
jgi:hypothetical protein